METPETARGRWPSAGPRASSTAGAPLDEDRTTTGVVVAGGGHAAGEEAQAPNADSFVVDVVPQGPEQGPVVIQGRRRGRRRTRGCAGLW